MRRNLNTSSCKITCLAFCSGCQSRGAQLSDSCPHSEACTIVVASGSAATDCGSSGRGTQNITHARWIRRQLQSFGHPLADTLFLQRYLRWGTSRTGARQAYRESTLLQRLILVGLPANPPGRIPTPTRARAREHMGGTNGASVRRQMERMLPQS